MVPSLWAAMVIRSPHDPNVIENDTLSSALPV
jgi:hypothetical protein